MTPQDPDGATVFVVDDHPSVRASLKRLLSTAGLHSEEFASGEEFLPRAAQGITGCVLLDVRMTGLNGVEVLQELTAAGNDIPVIFLTGHADVALTVRAMKAGAIELLTKPFEPTVLLEAVSRALERDRERRGAREELRVYRERFDRLTGREREVMQLVVTGLLNKQVADVLGTAEKTVKVHRGQVMRKMEAASLPALVRMADRLDVSRSGLSGHGASGVNGGFGWQPEIERRPAVERVLDPDPSVVRGDDRAADREPQPRTHAFGGHERFEQAR